MTLTKQDLELIKQTLAPEIDKVEHRIKASLQPEFDKVESRIKTSLQPEFDKLNRKIDKLRRDNRRDHNLIIQSFNDADHKLQNRIKKIEDHVFKPAW